MPAYDLNKNPDYVLGSTMNSARKVVDRPCLLINKLNVRKQRIWCIEDPEKNAVCSAEFIPVCSEGIDLRFLSYVVSGNAFTSYLEDCSSGSSNSQKRVTPDTIMNAEICIPSRAEQQKIGAYFKDLDHLITLHQYLFSKPSKNKLVHDSIFWEQRKLSNIADIVGGGTPSTSNPDYWDGDIDWYAPAEIGEQIFAIGSVRKITKDGLNHSSAKILPAYKTVLFTSRAGIGNMAILQRSAATNQGFQSLVCHDDIDPYFVFSMGDCIKTKAERVAAGSTFVEISGKKLGNLEFMFPNTDEQKAIGDYFRNLDHLITLHQRKIKYILKEVFIWIILIKRVALKKPLSLNYRIMVGRKRLLSILQNRI